MKIWFTADTHFNHTNIIEYEDRRDYPDLRMRPINFLTVEAMDKYIIDAWNFYVKPDDLVYHLGDFAFANKTKQREIREQLNGDIVLVRGNHDKKINFSLFSEVFDILERKFILADEEISITMCHYPMLAWSKGHYGSWNLFGHVHRQYKMNPYAERSMNVGWDIWNRPVNLDEIAAVFYKQFKENSTQRENPERENFYNRNYVCEKTLT